MNIFTYYFRWHDPCPGASYLRWYEKWHLGTSSAESEGIQAFSSKLGTFSGKLGTPRQRRRRYKRVLVVHREQPLGSPPPVAD